MRFVLLSKVAAFLLASTLVAGKRFNVFEERCHLLHHYLLRHLPVG